MFRRLFTWLMLSAILAFPAFSQGKLPPEDASLYFIWPQDGAVIKGAFWCRFGLRGMGVTHAGDDFPNSGHHHLFIDVNDPVDPNEAIPQDKNHLHFGAGRPRHVSSCRRAGIHFNWCLATRSIFRLNLLWFQKKLLF